MTSINEIRKSLSAVNPSSIDKLKVYAQVFKPEFKRFAESDRFRLNKPTAEELVTFGEKLERQAMLNTACNEAVSFSNQMGGTQTVIGLDYVTTAEIKNIFPLIAADQVGDAATMNDKIGIVRYEKVVASTTRGNVTEGQVLSGAGVGPEVYPAGFAGEKQIGEDFCEIKTGLTYSGKLDFAPIRPGYVNITLPGGVTVTDDQNGHLISNVCGGTINYASGEWTLTFAAQPAVAGKALVTYDTNFELGTVPTISLLFDAKVVRAQVYGLQSDTSIFTQYLMQKTFNYDTQKRTSELVQQMILNEQVSDLLAKIKVAALENSADVTQFDLTRPHGVSQQSHIETVDLMFKQISKKMAKRSGEGELTVALCDPDATTIISSMHKFKKVGKTSAYATFYGVYADEILVFNCPQLADSGKVYFLHKGESKFLAAAVNMTAMPLVTYEDIPVTYNLSQRRQGVFTLAAIDVLNPQMIQVGGFVNSPFPLNPTLDPVKPGNGEGQEIGG